MRNISICIPAYKRPDHIETLLSSIEKQTFKDYEIVVTDDSGDDSLKGVLEKYAHLPINYFRNEKPLGTPANWNHGISMARGEWIKIMHDDDWFVDHNSLALFAQATSSNKKFIVSRYFDVFESGKEVMPPFPMSARSKILEEPMLLLARNVIGPPSVTLIHSSIKDRYDTFMKWRVDIDYYIRLLTNEKEFHLIDKPLINVGISETQVTNSCIDKPEVELPEGLLLLHKYGIGHLNNIRVYDAWWRILRNVHVRGEEDLKQYTTYKTWPAAMLIMARHQSKLPASILRFGPFSKTAMTLSYLANRKRLKD